MNNVLQNVKISGNKLNYVYNGTIPIHGVMVWNVNGNHGMGPPAITIVPGSSDVYLPMAIGGGVLVTLKNTQQDMVSLCDPFLTSTPSPVTPSPTPIPVPNALVPIPYTCVGQCPPFLGNPISNEIELDGRCFALEESDYGKLWFFSSQKDGAKIVLPVLKTVGATVSIYNWASKEGYGPETAKPITICFKEPNNNVRPMFPINPGRGQKIIAIRGSSGNLRWVPIGM